MPLLTMNENFNGKQTERNGLTERRTIDTPPVKHELTPWKSLEGTKINYWFLLVPDKDGVKYRRYVCLFCSNCRDLKFL